MTIQQYRYFSNHDDKVVALGPHEVECGMVNLKLQFRVGPGTEPIFKFKLVRVPCVQMCRD